MRVLAVPQSSSRLDVPEANADTFSFRRLLVALDASDYADRALTSAILLAGFHDGEVTGIHAYAAKLHDNRFRQMEGGLPERYRKEEEMEHQREVHDDLITRGLGIISDSYHEVAEKVCDEQDVPYHRLSPEGKNYRRIVEAASSGDFDLLALGALGLGVVPGSRIGTVCERVVRRSPIDVLVVRDPARSLGDGPLVVGLDGSPRSFAALKVALDLGRRLEVPVHAVAAYDPYYHYVAFNKLSGTLSEEASKQFRFKDQEELHEEIIDEGIAKIYQSHLDVARTLAEEEGADLTYKLLDGKPYDVIRRYVEDVGASLLLLGKTGIHADPDLDIGGNSENLLRSAPCHMWFVQNTYTPPLEAVAQETITWTEEAEEKMLKVPEAARGMVRTVILRMAQESGHTVVTSSLIDEATARFCPDRGGVMAEEEETVTWSKEAKELLEKVGDPSLNTSIRLRAEKRARREKSSSVLPEYVSSMLEEGAAPAAVWSASALARLAQVPEIVRNPLRHRVEALAHENKASEITPELVEAGVEESREAMERAMRFGGHKTTHEDTDDGAGEGD